MSDTLVSPAKTAKPILGMESRGLRKHALDGVHTAAALQIHNSNTILAAAAMRPYDGKSAVYNITINDFSFLLHCVLSF